MATRQSVTLLLAVVSVSLIAVGCGGGGGPTQPEGSQATLPTYFSYQLSGGFKAIFSYPLHKDDSEELSVRYTEEDVSIDFPSLDVEDCTFDATVTKQKTKNAMVALTKGVVGARRQIDFIILKQEGTGAVRTRGPIGEAPHVMMCWGTHLGFCPFTFVGSDIDDPTSRREFRFPGGGNNALRLLLTEGSGSSFVAHEAFCTNDDPVTVVVQPGS